MTTQTAARIDPDSCAVDEPTRRELLQECHGCRVVGGCKPYNRSCGWNIGVRYGLYPEHIIANPPSLINVT